MSDALPDEFIDHCEQVALEVRADLGLTVGDAFSPRELAEQQAIKIETIERFLPAFPAEVNRLVREGPEAFAAATVFCGTRCLILVNPSQSKREEALSIAHELAHRELEHEPTWPLFDEQGRRRRSDSEEAQADYLAGAMFVPRSSLDLEGLEQNRLEASAARLGVPSKLIRSRVAAFWRKTPRWTPPLLPGDPGETGTINVLSASSLRSV
jgi:IrrE N-terminal-like domain